MPINPAEIILAIQSRERQEWMQKEQMRQQREQAAIQMLSSLAGKQQQQIDPSQVLSQLELRNIVNQMKGQGGLRQPMGQAPGGMPTTAMPRPASMPQISPQRPIAGGLGRQPMTQPQIRQQPLQRQYEKIFKGPGKYGQPEFETKETLASELAGKKAEEKIKIKTEVLKLSEKARANFGRSISLFSTLIAQAKGMQKEQKTALGKMGIKSTGLGLLPGIAGGLGVKTKRPWAASTASFRGQLRETAIGLNSILTGQNRVIRSVVQMIQETLPDPLDPEPLVATKLAQSITNAYKLVKAFEKAGLEPTKLQQMSVGELNNINARSLVTLYTLSKEETVEIDKIIDDVLTTPAMPARTFKGRQQQPIKKTFKSLWE